MTLFRTLFALLVLVPSVAWAQTPDDHLAAARQARAERNYQIALEEVSEGQRLAPDDGRLLYERVLILEAMDEPDLALGLLQNNRESMAKSTDLAELSATERRLERTLAIPQTPAPAPSPEVGEAESESDESLHLAGFFLVGGGGVFAASAITMILVASADQAQLDCTTGVRACDGANELENIDAAELERRQSRVDSLRIASLATAGVATGLLAWGFYALFTRPTRDQTAVNLQPTLTERSAGAQLQIRF